MKFKSIILLFLAGIMIDGCAKKIVAAGAVQTNQTETNSSVDSSSPTYGWKDTPFTYGIQKPYNLTEADRYSYTKATNTHAFLLHKGDWPFKADTKTSPRCEMRMKNDYSSGKHQFEADYRVAKGSDHPIIMQIFGTDKPGFMLKAYDENGGSFKQFDSKVLDTAIYDSWKHVNIVHDADDHSIKVYIDYVLRGTFKDKAASSHYFKCGLYTTRSDESSVEIKNIRYWTKQ